MSTVKIIDGHRFFFYSNETSEAPHIHIRAAEKEAKFWLEPIELVLNYGFNKPEINPLKRIVNRNKYVFQKTWNEYFA